MLLAVICGCNDVCFCFLLFAINIDFSHTFYNLVGFCCVFVGNSLTTGLPSPHLLFKSITLIMPLNCCVLGCFDRGKYCLPYNNPVIWMNWLKSCPYLRQYNIQQLECKRICSRHFIPEHFDTNTNSLTKKAVPLLNLPVCPDVTENNEENEEVIQAIEESIDPSLYSASIDDELILFDAEECIHIEQLEEIEFDPLQISPKLSPIDFDGYEESVVAYSPPPEPNPLEDPPQITENSECPPMVIPHPMKLPRVVLHRLPPNLQHCRVCPPPPPAPKPQPNPTKQKTENDNDIIYFNRPLRDSIMYYSLQEQTGAPPALVPANRIAKLKDKQLIKTYRNKFAKHAQFFFPKSRCYLQEKNMANNFGRTLTGIAGRGVHYTTKEKIFALSLVKTSPKGYKFLKRHVALPCHDSINSILDDIPLRAGINEFIFQHLANAAMHKTEEEKECALLFSEMKINKYLKFNVHTGLIEGFQDLGSGKRANKVGDKALVFMLCGLFQLWKLPIAYYFTGDLTENNNVIFQRILSEVVMAVFETGFVVTATVSDPSSASVEAINSFLADTDNSEDNIYYEIENKRLFHIYDVTNILECVKVDSRNDYQRQNYDAKWNFLETLFQINDNEKDDKILTENNQLESQAVNRPTEVEFWDSALRKLNSMKFNMQEGQAKLLPVNLFINNVKTTKKVWKDLQSRGSAFVRSLNLKPLNFLFRKIREKHCNITNINSNQFITAYRRFLINNLSSGKSLFTNTASNDDKILGVLINLTSNKKYSFYYVDDDLEQIIPCVKQISIGLPTIHGLCNYFVSNMPYKDCSQCQQSITPMDQSIHLAIQKSIQLVDDMLPEMVNFQIYPLILILQQEVNTSWFACAVHKTLFFRIFWIFIIKVRAKKWCSYYNVQKGYAKKQYFIPKN